MEKALAIILVAALAILVVGTLSGIFIYFLWNWLLTGDDSVIGVALPHLPFLKAIGVGWLCSALFKGGSSSSNNN